MGWKKQFGVRGAKARMCLSAALILTIATLALADDRTIIHPGFDLFSPQQDIELGRRAAAQVPRQFPLLNNKRVDDYLRQVGLRLVAHVPAGSYPFPYEYHCVNSEQINAFALPGGFIYVNRAVIEKADDEAELAAVMAHETGHVVLRHGTEQASKASGAQLVVGILGALTGGNAVASIVTQLFSGVGVPLVFLKMSRTDESQADIIGTQILHDAKYDPQAMADFFQKLQNQQRSPEFFSDHPSPEHRIERIDEEVDRLGRALPNATRDTAEFEKIKRYVKSLPAAPKHPQGTAGAEGSGGSAAPSTSYVRFSKDDYALRYPDNWSTQPQGDGGVLFVPAGGLVQTGQGNAAIVYGVIAGKFPVQGANGRSVSLKDATGQLIESLKQSNAGMDVMRQDETEKLGGQAAISTYLQGNSPAGGREADWLLTTMRPDGLFYLVCTAPQKDYNAYEGAFRAMAHSLEFTK